MSQSLKNDKLRLLHVEDNPGDIYIIRRALKKASVPTHVFNIGNAEDAMQHLLECVDNRKDFPDLILMDIHLPTINGDELLKWIKKNEKLKPIPVVVLSSSTSALDIKTMYECGAKAFLTKPNDIQEYDLIVDAVIKHLHSIVENRSSNHLSQWELSV